MIYKICFYAPSAQEIKETGKLKKSDGKLQQTRPAEIPSSGTPPCEPARLKSPHQKPRLANPPGRNPLIRTPALRTHLFRKCPAATCGLGQDDRHGSMAAPLKLMLYLKDISALVKHFFQNLTNKPAPQKPSIHHREARTAGAAATLKGENFEE